MNFSQLFDQLPREFLDLAALLGCQTCFLTGCEKGRHRTVFENKTKNKMPSKDLMLPKRETSSD